jgi:hypothetical protein
MFTEKWRKKRILRVGHININGGKEMMLAILNARMEAVVPLSNRTV